MKFKFKADYYQTVFGDYRCNISIWRYYTYIEPSSVFCGAFMSSDDFYHWVWGESQIMDEDRDECRDIMNMLTVRQRVVLLSAIDSSMKDKVSYTITLKMGGEAD